jgi:hypothetical protein
VLARHAVLAADDEPTPPLEPVQNPVTIPNMQFSK